MTAGCSQTPRTASVIARSCGRRSSSCGRRSAATKPPGMGRRARRWPWECTSRPPGTLWTTSASGAWQMTRCTPGWQDPRMGSSKMAVPSSQVQCTTGSFLCLHDIIRRPSKPLAIFSHEPWSRKEAGRDAAWPLLNQIVASYHRMCALGFSTMPSNGSVSLSRAWLICCRRWSDHLAAAGPGTWAVGNQVPLQEPADARPPQLALHAPGGLQQQCSLLLP